MSTAGSISDGCNTSSLRDYLLEELESEGLLGRGQLLDGSYTDRDEDRARLLQLVAEHPEGIIRSRLVHVGLYGVRLYGTDPWRNTVGFADLDWYNAEERHDAALDKISEKTSTVDQLDGSDSEYQFTYRFTKAAEEAGFVRLESSGSTTTVHPTLRLLDLISSGISETESPDDGTISDRAFVRRMLSAVDSHLSDAQKSASAEGLLRYIRRIDDYRLAFDVHVRSRKGTETRRMTKEYKTRFNSEDRHGRSFARLQDALDARAEPGATAAFTTLTTDPKRHDSLLDSIQNINPNFHRLQQYLSSDPSTKDDTRESSVSGWRPDLDSEVTGRPRETLDYLKVLEFASGGLPHLHTLYFDPPRRESDRMPWLIDKGELSKKWSDYDQGSVVDVRPLVFRDDLRPAGDPDDPDDGLLDLVPFVGSSLDDLGASTFVQECTEDTILNWYRREHDLNGVRFNSSEGWVDWYRYGENDLSREEAAERAGQHDLVDMEGDDEIIFQKTAGSYLGKYLSATYGALSNVAESFEDRKTLTSGEDDSKEAVWKLALYWATDKQFWSTSRDIERAIDPEEAELEGGPREAAEWASQDTILELSREYAETWVHEPDLNELTESGRAQSTLREVHTDYWVSVDYLGAYSYWDMPVNTSASFSLKNMEICNNSSEIISLSGDSDRPPPTMINN
ncbi:hypothetical protein [Halobellus clavatus]|uniref:Uncharacterized protein n=1 Tax=Halobellus clavatus TaxID=660517 RepID=A0A1H3DDL6_9EURY|nr:hypothetical protein [Halobellus clavatus]SDX64218.1 hypothetical protein SAMN04487946_101495 [Halobellus clavatus]